MSDCVEVISCRDCKYWSKPGFHDPFIRDGEYQLCYFWANCRDGFSPVYTYDYGYCYEAKKRDAR